MIKKIQLLTILCLFLSVSLPTHTHAQVKSKDKKVEKFSQEEKEKFSFVYEYTFKNTFDGIKSAQKHLPSTKLSEARFGATLSAQFGGQKVTLTPEEQVEMDKLVKLVEQDKKVYDDQVNKIVVAQNLDPKKYLTMKEEHTKNRFFQNEIYEIITKREILAPKK